MYVAKGLPNPKINTPPPTDTFFDATMGIQRHHAERAGEHLDLRLAMPQTGKAHSWAIPQGRMPKPGEKVLAVESGDHDLGYMTFSGTLTKGYGKGRVALEALDKIEVLESSPDKVTFAQYTGSGVNRYTLVKTTGQNWLLLNTTATNQTRPEIPQFKRSYSELTESQVLDRVRNENTLMAPKIDGAHVVFGLRPHRRIDVFSYRPSRKGSELIDHSFKTDLYKYKSPTSLGKTILRGELYGVDSKTQRPLHSAETGGLLNSGTRRSREMQKSQGKLTHLIYDIDTFRGKDVSQLPYSLKLELLKRVKQEMPELQIVQPARTYVEKSNLLDEVKSGKHPLSQEGVVVYNLHEATPEKYKITKDIDVYFHAPFSPLVGSRLEQMGAAGGFYASRELGGEPNIRVGGGLSDELRRDIAQNPEKYRNRLAKIYIQEELRSGKVRMPILKEFRDYEMWNSKQAAAKKRTTFQQLFLTNPTSDEQQSTFSTELNRDSGMVGGLPNINQVKSASVVNIEDLFNGMPQATKTKIAEALSKEKTSSILDPVRKTLCPDIFDITTNTLLPDAQLAIIKGLKTILGPELYKVKYVFLLGGSVSYQWTPDTDIDVNVIIPAQHVPDSETYGLLQTKMKSFRTYSFKGHPVSYTLKVESGTELENTDNTLSIFDVLNNTWVKAPDPKGVDMSWMVEINKPYLNLYSDFLRSGVKNLLKAVKRGEPSESLVGRAIDVSEAYKNVDRARKLSYQESFGIPNLSEANVAYKFLTKDPLIHRIEDIYHAIKPRLLKAWYN